MMSMLTTFIMLTSVINSIVIIFLLKRMDRAENILEILARDMVKRYPQLFEEVKNEQKV